jgi:hypothetical protein
VLPSDKREQYVAWLARVISRTKERREQPDRKERLAPAGKMKPGPQSRKKMVLALRAELYPKGLQGRPITEVRDHLRRVLREDFGVVLSDKQLSRYGIKKDME